MIKPVNFRDLGGMVGKDGKKIAEKRLLRSGELHQISQEDKEILLREYHLKAIVDFRGEIEVAQSPDDILPEVRYENLDILVNSQDKTTDIKDLIKNRSIIDRYMDDIYRIMVENEGARQGYRHFIDILLAEKEGAVLFHCFAGKDRTGIGAAIILEILGVSKNDILTDYLVTNELRKEDNERLINALIVNGLPEDQADNLRVALSVKQEYLDVAYEAVEKQYGSFIEYIKQGIGVTEEEIKILQNSYLE